MRVLMLSLLFLTCNVFCLSCNGSVYLYKAFTFPPGSLPHEDKWQYSGKVIVSSNESGPLAKKSKKKVQIKVTDRKENIMLSDDFSFVSANIEATVTWDKFDEIDIILSEVGNQYAEDQYNKDLLKNGPRQLACLKYRFDTKLGRFITNTKSRASKGQTPIINNLNESKHREALSNNASRCFV